MSFLKLILIYIHISNFFFKLIKILTIHIPNKISKQNLKYILHLLKEVEVM